MAKLIDDYAPAEAPEDLYKFSATIKRGIDGFAEVSAADIDQFHALGFIVIRDAYPEAVVDRARNGLRDLILRRDTDNIMIESAAADCFDDLSDAQRLNSVRKLMPIVDYDARLRAVADDPELLHVIRRIMGEAPALSQDMAMIKPPLIGREKPWHQDLAYFDYPADTAIVGAWIALDEATPENGCMMIIPGSHCAGPVTHWARRDWQICDTDVQVGRSAAVPLQPGSCLLFHCLLHHGTPPSRSRKTRWALQFHYRPRGAKAFADSQERLRTFGAEGKDVAC